MKDITRRRFTGSVALGTLGAVTACNGPTESTLKNPTLHSYQKLDGILNQSVLKIQNFKEPVIINRLELLEYNGNFICRVMDRQGATGLCISNNMQMVSFHPIFTHRLQPFFLGKDARNLEQLLEEVYIYRSNYKLQGLALWVPLATIEFAILDLLGRLANLSIGQLIGGIRHTEIAVYRANNHRGKSPEESLEKIIENVEQSKAKAVKFKIGGRMSALEKPEKRSERLIPMVREALGKEMTIYADSNGSYDVSEAIRMGKIMEEHQLSFYEEPVPFDWYTETLEVKNKLHIPIAGGEQESSMRNFRWLIANDALDVIQPDIFYFGGMLRSMKVALMAHAVGKTCVPHISGSGLGYLYMMHFVSALPNAGPYHEFKGFNKNIPFNCGTSDLSISDGKIKVPTGAGSGIDIDPDFVDKHHQIG